MSINKAACIASGMIGTGWALTFAWKGLQVNVYDIADIGHTPGGKKMFHEAAPRFVIFFYFFVFNKPEFTNFTVRSFSPPASILLCP